MDVTLNQGYPDRIGRRYAFVGFGVGPASYVTGGVAINIPGFEQYIDSVTDQLSVSGTYLLRGIPSGVGPRATWKAKIFVVSTGAEVASLFNLSAEKFVVAGFGGTY